LTPTAALQTAAGTKQTVVADSCNRIPVL